MPKKQKQNKTKKNSCDTNSWREERRFIPFPKGISPKVNVINGLEFELTYFEVVITGAITHRRYNDKTSYKMKEQQNVRTNLEKVKTINMIFR